MKLPKNYLQAQMFLGNKNRRSLSRVSGTFVQKVSSKAIKIVYGGYTFIEFKDDGNIVLNSGGKRSSAIKNRINALEEIVLFERAGKWYFYQVQASFPQLAPIFEFVFLSDLFCIIFFKKFFFGFSILSLDSPLLNIFKNP